MTTPRSIGLEQARLNLPSVVAQAHDGKISVITKHGKPFAAVVPVSMIPVARTAGLLALRGSGKGLWGKSASRGIATLRDEWS